MLTYHFQFVVLNFASVMCSGATVSMNNFVCLFFESSSVVNWNEIHKILLCVVPTLQVSLAVFSSIYQTDPAYTTTISWLRG